MNNKHQTTDIPSLGTYKVRDIEYTKDDCIEDLKDLASNFPDRRITRDFYRKNGNIPEIAWTNFFGTFQEFIRQSELDYTRFTNQIRLQTAKHASFDNLKDISELRKSYGSCYIRENKKRFKTLIACSDLHDINCDLFYLRVLFETIRIVEPDVVCINGDLFDLPEFSRHLVDPREWDTVGRLNYGLDIIKNMRESAPNAQIDLIEGNHEGRLVKHLMEVSPALRSLLGDFHGFDLRRMLKLDEYEVNYIANSDLHAFTNAQLRREMIKNYKLYWGCLLAHHFPIGRGKGVPGFHGHHHQHIVWTEHNAKMGSYEWHQMGCGHIRQASYCDGTKWNNGFLIANVDTQTQNVVFDYTSVGDTFSISGGTWYYREFNEFYPGLENEIEFRKYGS
jgi:hypothetical protein